MFDPKRQQLQLPLRALAPRLHSLQRLKENLGPPEGAQHPGPQLSLQDEESEKGSEASARAGEAGRSPGERMVQSQRQRD